MKAALINEKGSLDNILIQELPIPTIKPNQVLVKVIACGINPIDWKGVLHGRFETPYILGSDIAGVIHSIGNEVTQFKTGDEIIGSLEWSKQGAFTEYLATEEKYLTLKPKNLSFDEAASIPLASLTAWQGLFDKLNLQSDQKVLIQAAAGGVGMFAVQFAHMIGAHVVGVASEKNSTFVKSFGANEVFDYQNPYSKLSNDFDAVFDSMASSEQTIPLLKKGGKYVSITAKPSPDLAEKYEVEASNFLFHSNQEQLKEIVNLIEQGKIKTFLDKKFQLTDVKKALEYQLEGHSKGKNILLIEDT